MQTLAQAAQEALATARTTQESPKSSNWRPSIDAYDAGLVKAAAVCAKFAADMEAGKQPYWLTLRGRQGVGKTMLARQVFEFAKANCNPGRHALWVAGTGIYSEHNRRPNCAWFSAAGFKDRMMGGDYNLPEYLRADYLVVIDDLGASRDTRDNALADGIYRLAEQRSGRWMIWTTNLTMEEIENRLDPRISSRLIRDDNKLLSISAQDYALRPKLAGEIRRNEEAA